MKNYIYTSILILLLNFRVISQEIEINGIIADAETKNLIEFVNIGILNKNIGTISNLNGEFNLRMSNTFSNDSLTISHINYYNAKVSIKDFKNQTIILNPKTNQLPEVVISNRKNKKRKIGVKSYNPFLFLGSISEGNDIIENAQKINVPDTRIKVSYVNLYLKKGFQSDSSFIRVNFYKNVENTPGEKIVFENIVKKKQIEPGWLKIDLTENDVYIEEDFFVGVEFIPDFKNQMNVYMGAILSRGKGYTRNSSQGKWDKLPGASSINVEIEY